MAKPPQAAAENVGFVTILHEMTRLIFSFAPTPYICIVVWESFNLPKMNNKTK